MHLFIYLFTNKPIITFDDDVCKLKIIELH